MSWHSLISNPDNSRQGYTIHSQFMRHHSIKPVGDKKNNTYYHSSRYTTDREPMDYGIVRQHNSLIQDIRFRFQICSASVHNSQLPMPYMTVDITKMQLNCPLGLSLLVATIQSQLSYHGGKYLSWITPTTPLAQIQLSLYDTPTGPFLPTISKLNQPTTTLHEVNGLSMHASTQYMTIILDTICIIRSEHLLIDGHERVCKHMHVIVVFDHDVVDRFLHHHPFLVLTIIVGNCTLHNHQQYQRVKCQHLRYQFTSY